jgi:hypothetical protein
MKLHPLLYKTFYSFLFLGLFTNCRTRVDQLPPVFDLLDSSKTGLLFANRLQPSATLNMFSYMYFYNGGGVGAGDFNNDGLIDVFFSANQAPNSLYLNKGNLHFEDVSRSAGITDDGGWSTGVSIVDINHDGWLDIYVCRVGDFGNLHAGNQLWICKGLNNNGIPVYEEQAARFGLDFKGFCTQAAFFDYDLDGDLDCFLLNHSVHRNGSFAPRVNFLGTYHPLSGDRMYRNDGQHFTDITKISGINSSSISYGLGIAVSDFNNDGYPDLYIGNDFHENDYLYINEKDGKFSEVLTDRIMHTSQFSMGVDIADVTNDGYPEIISMDMLPSDPYILKRSLGEDEFDIFNYKISAGYNHQYTRNSLQLNRRNGMFSEVGLYAGIFASDWSWAPLWMDFDNDGKKDLFISNGIPKRMNDMDYVNFVSNEEIQQKISTNSLNEKDLALVNKFPEIKIPNRFFLNKGDLQFTDIADRINNNQPTYSNGAVYADFDNDGDLDVIVTNIDQSALLYKNTQATLSNDTSSSISIQLRGDVLNPRAIGASVILFYRGEIRTYEKYPVRGFQSSMEIPLLIGHGKKLPDSAWLVWPDHTCEKISWRLTDKQVTFTYKKGLPQFNDQLILQSWKEPVRPMIDISLQSAFTVNHIENIFGEFDREPLIPHMLSTEGPTAAIADVNGDGLEDIFLGSSREQVAQLYLQTPNGRFAKSRQPAFEADSIYEETGAVFADVDKDGSVDLVVSSGGNEFFGPHPNLLPRIYHNNGKGIFTKTIGALPEIFVNAAGITAADINADGAMDLIVGGRNIPYEYGMPARSYILINNGKGSFKDATTEIAPELSSIAMVTHVSVVDLNHDQQTDLIIATEWDGIYAFINQNGHLVKQTITDKKGWWNFVVPLDVDGDGDLDLVAGNLGLNSRLKASKQEPLNLYVGDFDGNGRKEQLLTYYLNAREIPFNNKDELQRQLPSLKKKYLYAADFAKAKLTDIISSEQLNSAIHYKADELANVVLLNDGQQHFTARHLPWMAQLSSMRDGVVIDANGDQLPDVLLVGNYYQPNIQMGRYDADFGTVLLNKGGGNFSAENINGLTIKGQSRRILPIQIKGKPSWLIARNNDRAMLIQFAQ